MHQINQNSPAAAPRQRAFDLNSPRTLAIARVLIPLLFGLYSLFLGADSNWDLYNYHMYNPFAWLHGKLQIDLAPAGMQSYFNPLLDVPFYLAFTHLPARLVGFAMGALHGLSFIFILGIAQRVLPGLLEGDRNRVPLLLALAGCLTANFLSGLGNSMGDDTTALLSLAALLMLVSNWQRIAVPSWRTAAIVAASGLVVGLGAGLKLTNAVFALAMCFALLFYPGTAGIRLLLAFVFGIGVLAGLASTGGYWMVHMWRLYGNPLYPQFGGLFPNPLVQRDAVADVRWRPHGWFETAVWPFVFTLNSHRVGETEIRQIIWPVAYVLFWIWAVVSAMQLIARRTTAVLDSRARFVVVFVALGYVVWMELFSIYRYIVAIEVITPLVTWILLQRLLPYRAAKRIAGWLLVAAAAVVVTGGGRTWGHEGWTDPVWHAEVPTLDQPERTTIVLASTRARAWGWIATLFPDNVAFTQLESSFPATPAFVARMHEIARQRGGPIYAIIDGEDNWRIDNVADVNALVDRIGVTESTSGCNVLRWTVQRLHLHASVLGSMDSTKRCALGLRADDLRDLDAENRADREAAVPMFARNGFTLDPSTCVRYRAGIGKGTLVYQWCSVTQPGDH